MPPSRTVGVRRLIAVAAAAVLVASTLALSPPAAAQTQPFTDTSSDSYYSDAVTALADNGIFDGTECAEGMLCPNEPIDRKTMAVWTVRALDGADPAPASGDRFTDVDANSFHAPFIERMDELGVTSGCGDGTTFCPHDTVTRAEMAVFLTRAFNLDPGPDPSFSDVAADAWYYTQAAALAASGITAGCGDGTTFCPNQPTTRAQMATFLARALGFVALPTTTQTTTYEDLAAGIGHMCVLLTDGTVTCWLATHLDDPTDDTSDRSPTTISSSHASSIQAPEGSYKTIHAGGTDACAIRTDDTITCWSFDHGEWDFFGQISVIQNIPQQTYKSVVVGEGHTCAIGTDDTITCWGNNNSGQADAPTGTYKTITAGNGHTCAIGTDDTITCWGNNNSGQADAPTGTYKTIAAGEGHTCAIGTDDTITCWGHNNSGQADAPTGTHKTIVSSRAFACAIGTDDTITCWGHNNSGQADAPTGTYKTIAVGNGGSFAAHYACAIGTDDTITCWGSSWAGQADEPKGTYKFTGTYKTIAAGEGHTCAIGTDDTITCWGAYFGRDSG